MKLSERAEEYKGRILGFLKFGSELSHLESLRKGNIYMNNFNYFIELEKKTGKKGMGDKNEAAQVMSNMEINFYDPITNELMGTAHATSMNFRYDDYKFKPVFCLYAITAEMFEIVEETEEYCNTALTFTYDQRQELLNSFGEHVLYIKPEFTTRISNYLNENDYAYTRGMVKYRDFSVNEKERLEAYHKQDTDSFFFKDIYFKNQNEYRLVILNNNVEDKLEINIGNLEDIAFLLNSQDVLNGKLGLRFHNDLMNKI
jgi:hypothetical protein